MASPKAAGSLNSKRVGGFPSLLGINTRPRLAVSQVEPEPRDEIPTAFTRINHERNPNRNSALTGSKIVRRYRLLRICRNREGGLGVYK
jgi:hypothetical protein